MTPDSVDRMEASDVDTSLVAAVSTAAIPLIQPSASYSITVRVRDPQRPGGFARIAGAIGETGAILGAIDLVRVEGGEVVRDVTVACVDATHGEAVVAAVGGLKDVTVEHVSDRTFLMHLGGKLEVKSDRQGRSCMRRSLGSDPPPSAHPPPPMA